MIDELLCPVASVAGKDESPQNEASCLWLPPCQWGDPALGLDHPRNYRHDKSPRDKTSELGRRALWGDALFQGRGAYKLDD